MILVPAAAAIALLLLPGAAEHFGRGLRPAEWARLCSTALSGGAILFEAVLVLRATTGMLRAAGLHSFAHACDRILGPLVAGGAPASWAAAIAAIALPTAAAIAARRAHNMRRRLADDLWLGQRHTIAGHTVIELPLQRPLAISFDDGEPAIVISTGLLDLLSPDEVIVVVRHEAAHLRHRHQRLRSSAMLVPLLSRVPGIRRSVAALNLSIERWADEDACANWPAGRQALRTSLLRLANLPTGLGGATQYADAQTIAGRLESLEAIPRPVPAPIHVLLYLPGTMALLVAMPAMYQWLNQTRALLAFGGRCPL